MIDTTNNNLQEILNNLKSNGTNKEDILKVVYETYSISKEDIYDKNDKCEQKF